MSYLEDGIDDAIDSLRDYIILLDYGTVEIADNIITKIGFSHRLKGTKYLIQAVDILLIDQTAEKNITQNVYGLIAATYGITNASIDKCMRIAIEDVWLRTPAKELKQLYPFPWGQMTGRPSNVEFIKNVAQIIRENKKR